MSSPEHLNTPENSTLSEHLKAPETAEHEEMSREELKALGQRHLELQKSEAPQRARQFITEASDLEDDFEAYLGRLASSGRTLTEQEFIRWEDDLAFNWDQHKRALAPLRLEGTEARIAEAAAEYPMMLEPEDLYDTIEVRAGQFFQARAAKLREAIETEQRPTAAEDREALTRYWQSAHDHIEIRYITSSDMERSMKTMQELERERTMLHNQVIKDFNTLNAVARSYGVRPFAVREFWTSDAPQPTIEVKKRMKHDRHQVELYTERAFPDFVAKQQHRLERSMDASNIHNFR